MGCAAGHTRPMMHAGTARPARHSCYAWALAACALAGSLPGLAHSDALTHWGSVYTQPVQWSTPPNAGLTPEQLFFALRKRELGAQNYAACTALNREIQRLQRSHRKAAPEERAHTEVQLAQAQQRLATLRCPVGKPL